MGANFYGAERTLIYAVSRVDAVLPRSYPNRPLPDQNKPDGLWLNLYNFRGATEPVTLGDAGEDENNGFFQIDLNYPQNKGSKEILEKADEFARFFTAGKSLSFNDQKVKILSTSLSPGREVGGYYRVSLTINYYTRTMRNLQNG